MDRNDAARVLQAYGRGVTMDKQGNLSFTHTFEKEITDIESLPDGVLQHEYAVMKEAIADPAISKGRSELIGLSLLQLEMEERGFLDA